MNTLTVIGYLSNRYCYLNLDIETCIARYCQSENLSAEEFKNEIGTEVRTFEFSDEFCAYDAYEK